MLPHNDPESLYLSFLLAGAILLAIYFYLKPLKKK